MTKPRVQPSYQLILKWVEENPGVLAVFPDEYLDIISDPLPLDPEVAEPIQGEILVRAWLYQNQHPYFLDTFITNLFGEGILNSLNQRQSKELIEHNEIPRGIKAYFYRRIADFTNCDGIIPLACLPDLIEAVALPFNLIETCNSDPKIRDRLGAPIPNWENFLAIIGESKFEVCLLAELGFFSDRLEGNSFGLSVGLAMERRGSSLVGEFAPLAMIASGALTGGKLESVGGIEAKRVLATKMGAKFVVVSDEEQTEKNTLLLAPNSLLDEAYISISRSIDDWNICQLDPDSAAQKLKTLSLDLRLGTVDPEAAETRLDRYESVLEAASGHPTFDEEYLNARLLRATIANHKGNPSTANLIFTELLDSEECSLNPELFVEASAGQIVSLVDGGYVKEAEGMARDLVDWIAKGNLVGTVQVRNRCRMKAYGVLGGQALLHKALSNSSVAEESLKCLKIALSAAEDLRHDQEIAFDLVQIVLWHSLFQPEQAEPIYQETFQRLATMETEFSDLSKDYLRAHRFLGAYRCLIGGKDIPSGFIKWELPAKGSSACDWLRATALKYRGALLGHIGNISDAEKDFHEAMGLMEYPTSPLLRLISGTIAAEASLQKSEELGYFRRNAINRFSSLPAEFIQRFSVCKWSESLQVANEEHLKKLIRQIQWCSRY